MHCPELAVRSSCITHAPFNLFSQNVAKTNHLIVFHDQFVERVPDSAAWEALQARVRARMPDFGVTMDPDVAVHNYAATAYDAVELLAR